MKIGITQKHVKDEFGRWKDVLENNYIQYFSKYGLDLIPISNVIPNFDKFCENTGIEGFIISGGMGVPATLWGEEIKFTNNFSEDRTNTDKKVLDYAIKKKLPVLGICTGLHYINVYFNGKLLQNIKAELKGSENHVANNHKIEITDQKAILLLGKKDFLVNSYHNQGITKDILSNKLKEFAICPEDKTIEGAYHPKYPIIAVTWHPERESPNESLNEKIIKALLNKEVFWKNK